MKEEVESPLGVQPHLASTLRGSQATVQRIQPSTAVTRSDSIPALATRTSAFVAALLLAVAPAVIKAQTTVYYDTSTTSGYQGGAGNWRTNQAFWTTNGTTLSNWTNGNNAVINTLTAATITITGNITANQVTFVSTGTTVGGTSNLQLTGSGIIDAQSDATISAPITGTVGLSKTGAGTLTLSNNSNSYTGLTNITQGTLAMGASNVFANTSTLTVNGATSVLSMGTRNDTVAGVTLQGGGSITGTGTLTSTTNFALQSGTVDAKLGGSVGVDKTTSGTVTLNGANTYTGATTISGGTLSIGTINNAGANGVLGNTTAGAANLVLNNGTLQYTGANASTNRAFTITAGSTGTFDIVTNNLTFSAASAATTGNLTKIGAGTLTLSGANAYTGLTTVSEGTLALGASNVLANTSTLTVTGGTSVLSMGANSETLGLVTLQNGGSITGSGTLTSTSNFALQNGSVSAKLGGSVGIDKTTSGTVTLSGANTFTGLTNITGGTLALGASNVLADTSTLTVNGASSVFSLGANSDTVGLVTLQNGGSINGSGTLTSTSNFALQDGTVSAKLGGSVGINKTTSGTVTLSGANTFTGATSITGGTLKISADDNLGTAPGAFSAANITLGGGTLEATGSFALNVNRGITLTAATSSNITASTGATLNYGGQITGGGNLTFGTSGTGTGTVWLWNNAGASNYTGTTTIDYGKVLFAGNSALPTATSLTINSNGTLDLGLYNGTIGSLAGSGTVDLSGGSVGTKTLTVGDTSSTTFSGTITDSGTGNTALALTKQGSGTLTLSGTNSYSGATTVNAGILSISADSNLGTAPGSATAGQLTLGGGTLQTTSSLTLNSNRGIALTTATSSNVSANTGTTLNYGGVMAGSGNITYGTAGTGTGTIALTGANTNTGVTTLTAGTVAVSTIGDGGVAGGLGQASNAAANLVFNGGTLSYTGATASTDRNFTINTGKTATIDVSTAATTLTMSGASTSSNGALNKTGDGTLALSGSNLLTGATTVSAGTLTLQSAGALGSGTAGTTVLNGATLKLDTTTGAAAFNGTLTLNGTGAAGAGGALVTSGTSSTKGWLNNIALGSSATVANYSSAGQLQLGAASTIFDRTGWGRATTIADVIDTNTLNLGSNTLTLTGSGGFDLNSRIIGDASSGLTISLTDSTKEVWLKANTNPDFAGTTWVKNGTLVPYTLFNTVPNDPTFGNENYFGLSGPVIIGDGTGAANTAILRINAEGTDTSEMMSFNTPITIKSDGLLSLGSSQTIGALTFDGGRIDLFNAGSKLYLNGTVTVSTGANVSIDGTDRDISLTMNKSVFNTATNADRIFDTVGTGSLTINGALKNGGIVKNGTGTLTLNGNSTGGYERQTVINDGVLSITHANSLGQYGTAESATIVNGGTLRLSNNISVLNEYLTLNGNGYSGNGALQNQSGTNSWGGTITLGSNSRIQSETSSQLTISGSITSASNANLEVTGGGKTIISGIVGTGNGGITKNGSGELYLSGNNTYQGATTINAGSVQIEHASALGGTTGTTTVASGAELRLAGGITTNNEALTLNGTGTGGEGALRNYSGNGTTTGNNTYAGLVTLASDSLISAKTGTTFTLSGGTSSTTAGLTVGHTTENGDINITGMSNGTGALTKNGSGTVTVNGTTATMGAVNLNAGTLNFNSTTSTTTGAIAAAATLNFNSPTATTGTISLNTGGSMTVSSSTTVNSGAISSATGTTLTIATGGTVNANYAANAAMNGTMAGGGTFVKTGAGTLTLNTGFTASGLDLTLSAGTLAVVGNYSVDKLTLAGGTFKLTNAGFTAQTIHITGNTILDFSNSAGTFLTSAALIIDNGVTVTINGWVSVANTASSSTIWYATSSVTNEGNTLSTQAGPIYTANMTNVTFAGYSEPTAWVSGGNPMFGWFDKEIRPTPEPSTYGLIFLSSSFGLLGLRRWLRKKRSEQ